jgi:hypothetical protein
MMVWDMVVEHDKKQTSKGEKTTHGGRCASHRTHRVWWGYYTVGVWFALEIARDVGLW